MAATRVTSAIALIGTGCRGRLGWHAGVVTKAASAPTLRSARTRRPTPRGLSRGARRAALSARTPPRVVQPASRSGPDQGDLKPFEAVTDASKSQVSGAVWL